MKDKLQEAIDSTLNPYKDARKAAFIQVLLFERDKSARFEQLALEVARSYGERSRSDYIKQADLEIQLYSQATDQLHKKPESVALYAKQVYHSFMRGAYEQLASETPPTPPWKDIVREAFLEAHTIKDIGDVKRELRKELKGRVPTTKEQETIDLEETKALRRINDALKLKPEKPKASAGRSKEPTPARTRITITPKKRGGARAGAGRPAAPDTIPTRVFPVRIPEDLYDLLVRAADNAALSVSAFTVDLIERRVKR